jgi:hypothetical protein
MVAQLKQPDVFSTNLVDHAVLTIDPPGPTTLEGMLERLWLPDATERFTQYLSQQTIDSLQLSGISRLPGQIILPSFGREEQIHPGSTLDQLVHFPPPLLH